MSRAGVTPTPRKVVEQAPRKGRGLSKKTLQRQAEEAADEEKKAKEKEHLEDLQAMRDALPPIGVEWVPRRYTPRASRRSPALLLPRYREAVDDRTLGFYQIDDRSWVAELANLHTFATTSGVYSWTLLRCEVDAREQVTFDCSPCPDNALHGTCVHKLVLESDDPPPFVEMSGQENRDVVLFEYRCPSRMRKALFMFLVTVKTDRVFVSFYGNKASKGEWVCRKDPRNRDCAHVKRARTTGLVERILKAELVSQDEGDDSDREPHEDPADAAMKAEQDRVDKQSLLDLEDESCVSRVAVGPPAWARIPSDTARTAAPNIVLPPVLPLGDDPRCRCGSSPKAGAPVKEIACTVYGLHCAVESRIQVQACGACPPSSRRYAGPDLGEYGVFNFNNARLFRHELFDSFTSMLTAVEAPFTAFRTIVERDYETYGSPRRFVRDKAFRTAWFSFSSIQDLGVSFQCSLCGDNPKTVILDGVTAGFGARHVTTSLQPPTMIHADAPKRPNVRPVPENTVVTGRLRATALKVVRWKLALQNGKTPIVHKRRAKSNYSDNSEPDEDIDTSATNARVSRNVQERDQRDAAKRESISVVAADLERKCPAVASLFKSHLAPEWNKGNTEQHRPYARLLEQVLGHEPVLQFAPAEAHAALWMFAEGDVTSVDVLLSLMPALGVVAKLEMLKHGSVSTEVREVARFVAVRAVHVLAALKAGSGSPDDAKADLMEQEDWRQTGCFYGGPRIRNRPDYPNLKSDKKTERATVTESGGSIGCNKYYETYGKKGLTGGLMVAWCTHSVCLGFHCIPKGEGRNDVFSAIFTHWENPPKYIIYDFACALGPYCMLREPEFWQNTRFLIDRFHQHGHYACSPACFLSTYIEFNEDLRKINSSAGESGNAGLAKIRRPLSYMSQRRAVIFVYVYFAIWNRLRYRAAQRKANSVDSDSEAEEPASPSSSGEVATLRAPTQTKLARARTSASVTSAKLKKAV